MCDNGKQEEKNCVCVNCGKKVNSLFKEYSATVLKLTDCENCHSIADKYVEYDVVIIIIDLVLLQIAAYRHALFNVDFKAIPAELKYRPAENPKENTELEKHNFIKLHDAFVDKSNKANSNFWKLSVIILLMEAYSELMRNSSNGYIKAMDDEKPFLNEFNEIADFLFYKLSFNVALKTTCFIVVLYVLTRIYCKIANKEAVSFLMIWKSLTISSFGTFLLLPSLIWDTSVQEFHLCVVSLYTTMTQLLAYTALCDCPKLWSIIAILCGYCCKTFCFDFFDTISNVDNV